MDVTTHIAHVKKGPDDDWIVQSVEEHLKATAALAQQFCRPFPWGAWARAAALWHDVGKYSPEFQNRIRRESGYETDGRSPRRVDHSTAGAQHAFCKLGDAGKLLGYAIAGHHAGLPDGKTNDDSCLAKRLQKNVPEYPACPEHILDHKVDPRALPFPADRLRPGFGLSFFIRMLFSCVVDADRLDSEKFTKPRQAEVRAGYPSLADLQPSLMAHLDQLSARADQTLTVNRHRDAVLRQCLDAADEPQGMFSLTVPTGGGKTLSSLAFAIEHALVHGLDRIIYVIPYTSIIEQNAKVFRNALGERAVLEHHCNFDPSKGEDDGSDDPTWEKLAAENWDAPIVVTTSVQFFESLFSSRPSRCRKLHNIMNSVVILDEAQMLPVHLLRPCLEALRELATCYRTSVVLCTATQPALLAKDDFPEGLKGVHEIVSAPDALYNALKRVNVEIIGKLPDTELAARLKQHKQVLCIVNTRRHARKLYEMIKKQRGAYHLSALMCPAHRSEVLERIRAALEDEEPCKVISTQLVEAGVDIDFPVVYRSMAGIDSIAQAAGRCNREGKHKVGSAYVFEPEGGLPVGDLRHAAETAQLVMRHHAEDPLELDSVREYFQDLYWLKGDKLDEKQIMDDLKEGAARGNFPFRDVARKFRLIENDTKLVIVPWSEKGEQLVETLRSEEPSASLARRAQRFTVQVYPQQYAALVGAGSVEVLWEQYPVLVSNLYRSDVGLCPDDPTSHQADNLIC